jgi:cytochrome c oxidase assembly protein subunit 15
LILVVVQVALGISTLLLVVPVPLAALHQAGAVLVFAAALNVAHALR